MAQGVACVLPLPVLPLSVLVDGTPPYAGAVPGVAAGVAACSIGAGCDCNVSCAFAKPAMASKPAADATIRRDFMLAPKFSLSFHQCDSIRVAAKSPRNPVFSDARIAASSLRAQSPDAEVIGRMK
jgi:hypothetical protein